MLGEFGLGRETLDAGDLTEQLCGGERAAADEIEQLARLFAQQPFQLAIEFVDAP